MKKFLKFMVYVFGMTIVGIIFVSALTNSSISWSSIGKVQGTVAELFYVYPSIYVRTSDNLLYACDQHQKSCSPVDSSDIPADSLDETCRHKPKIDLALAPSKVVASSVTSECGAYGTVESHMIACDDGTIWIRYRSWNIFSMVCPALGGFIGLIVGLLIFLRSLRHKSQEKRKR